MKNTLGDLNNHLFAQLECLRDKDLKGEALVEEIKRSSAVVKLAEQISTIAELSEKIATNGNLALKARACDEDNINAENIRPQEKIATRKSIKLR